MINIQRAARRIYTFTFLIKYFIWHTYYKKETWRNIFQWAKIVMRQCLCFYCNERWVLLYRNGLIFYVLNFHLYFMYYEIAVLWYSSYLLYPKSHLIQYIRKPILNGFFQNYSFNILQCDLNYTEILSLRT